jgi:hypothetical protein
MILSHINKTAIAACQKGGRIPDGILFEKEDDKTYCGTVSKHLLRTTVYLS